MKFSFYKQPDFMDCRATCIRIIAKYYGRSISLADSAEKIGFRTLGVKVDFKKLVLEAPLPCVVHWNQQHFVVVYAIKKKASFLSSLRGTKQSYELNKIASLIFASQNLFAMTVSLQLSIFSIF